MDASASIAAPSPLRDMAAGSSSIQSNSSSAVVTPSGSIGATYRAPEDLDVAGPAWSGYFPRTTTPPQSSKVYEGILVKQDGSDYDLEDVASDEDRSREFHSQDEGEGLPPLEPIIPPEADEGHALPEEIGARAFFVYLPTY